MLFSETVLLEKRVNSVCEGQSYIADINSQRLSKVVRKNLLEATIDQQRLEEVDVICVGVKGERKREAVKGVKVHRVYFLYHRDNVLRYLTDYITFFILASFKLALLSLKRRYDVIEVHTMPDFLVFVTLFPKLLGSRVILYMFENAEQLFVSSFNVNHKHIFTRFMGFISKISASYRPTYRKDRRCSRPEFFED